MGQLRRVFVGASIPPEARLAISERVESIDIPGNAVPEENWHITLRFLGAVSDVTYERFLGSLSQQQLPSPFRIGLEGVGAFPKARKATVLWIGVGTGADKLESLSSAVDASAEDAGLTGEDRPFVPHLTLSRIRPPEDVSDLEDVSLFDDISWRCQGFVVYESLLGGGPPRYEPLEVFPFKR